MRAPRTHVHFMFNMCILTFPYAFLPRNHEHFMNWKDRKPFEERAAPWAGLKTWPAIAVDQDTASRTKRGEPNLWTHFGKRVRMLACSIRCFEHLVVSNRSGLFFWTWGYPIAMLVYQRVIELSAQEVFQEASPWKGLVLRGCPSKIEAIWVPGIHIHVWS